MGASVSGRVVVISIPVNIIGGNVNTSCEELHCDTLSKEGPYWCVNLQ